MVTQVSRIIKRKFKQRLSTISPIPTKRTRFKSLSTKRPRHIAFNIQALTWDRHKNVTSLNRLMGSQSLLIIGCPTTILDINKLYKTCIDSLSFKKPNAITKMNDNIKTNSTNEGSLRMHAKHMLMYICTYLFANLTIRNV